MLVHDFSIEYLGTCIISLISLCSYMTVFLLERVVYIHST